MPKPLPKPLRTNGEFGEMAGWLMELRQCVEERTALDSETVAIDHRRNGFAPKIRPGNRQVETPEAAGLPVQFIITALAADYVVAKYADDFASGTGPTYNIAKQYEARQSTSTLGFTYDVEFNTRSSFVFDNGRNLPLPEAIWPPYKVAQAGAAPVTYSQIWAQKIGGIGAPAQRKTGVTVSEQELEWLELSPSRYWRTGLTSYDVCINQSTVRRAIFRAGAAV